MKVKVHMLAFEDDNVVREVTIPDSESPDLDLVFYYGQNDFAIGPEKNTTCSVSVGDVIELNGEYIMVQSVGFKTMSLQEFENYKSLTRRRRSLLHWH